MSIHVVSIITCRQCGAERAEIMAFTTCRIDYECTRCGIELRPKAGDCCVFCSYGDEPCPSMQEHRQKRRDATHD